MEMRNASKQFKDVSDRDGLRIPNLSPVEPRGKGKLEEVLAHWEPLRIHWMKHHNDPEERLAAKNPERFVL